MLVQNYQNNSKKIRSKKTKRSDNKYFLIIDFLTETTQKYTNFLDVKLVLHILILFWLSFRFIQSNE